MDMNINILSNSEVQTLNEIIENAQNIVICCHKSPDGDALGSSLGWANFLSSCGKASTIVAPDAYPDFLQWMPGANSIVRYDKHTEQATTLLQNADLMFCLDFNGSDRVDEMKDALDASPAKKVMIDHHLNPQDFCHTIVSHPEMCATSEVLCHLMEQMGIMDKML
jgi:phosphoesterase RecJ-like protein